MVEWSELRNYPDLQYTGKRTPGTPTDEHPWSLTIRNVDSSGNPTAGECEDIQGREVRTLEFIFLVRRRPRKKWKEMLGSVDELRQFRTHALVHHRHKPDYNNVWISFLQIFANLSAGLR